MKELTESQYQVLAKELQNLTPTIVESGAGVLFMGYTLESITVDNETIPLGLYFSIEHDNLNKTLRLEEIYSNLQLDYNRIISILEKTRLPIYAKCLSCGKYIRLVMSINDYTRWRIDTPVQRAFPYLKASEREVLISETCGECFDKLFDE